MESGGVWGGGVDGEGEAVVGLVWWGRVWVCARRVVWVVGVEFVIRIDWVVTS